MNYIFVKTFTERSQTVWPDVKSFANNWEGVWVSTVNIKTYCFYNSYQTPWTIQTKWRLKFQHFQNDWLFLSGFSWLNSNIWKGKNKAAQIMSDSIPWYLTPSNINKFYYFSKRILRYRSSTPLLPSSINVLVYLMELFRVWSERFRQTMAVITLDWRTPVVFQVFRRDWQLHWRTKVQEPAEYWIMSLHAIEKWVLILSLLLVLQDAVQPVLCTCRRQTTDTTFPSPFICTYEVTIRRLKDCSTQVIETILFPHTNGNLLWRDVVLFQGQSMNTSSISVKTKGTSVKFIFTENNRINVPSNQTDHPVEFEFSYIVLNGVRKYTGGCQLT